MTHAIVDVPTTPRRKLSDRERLAVWERDKGCCYLCDRKLSAGDKWEAEHPRALGLGGNDDPRALHVICEWCLPGKNKSDMARIAKAKRGKARHIGGPRRKSRGFRGWKRFNGEIVWRERHGS